MTSLPPWIIALRGVVSQLEGALKPPHVDALVSQLEKRRETGLTKAEQTLLGFLKLNMTTRTGLRWRFDPKAIEAAKEVLTKAPPFTGPHKRASLLSWSEEQRLARRWRDFQDKKALDQMVSSHLGLVIRIAMEFRSRSRIPLKELIQEGNFGLVIAAHRFDPNRGTRLATYATYWIRACLMEVVTRNRWPVRIGTTRWQRKIFFGLGRAQKELEREGAVVDDDSLARKLGVRPEQVKVMRERLTAYDISLDAVHRRGSDTRRLLERLVVDAPTPEDIVASDEETNRRHKKLLEGINVLDRRERAIITARRLSERPKTLEQLGKRFGISRERVRQLEKRAMEKMRARLNPGKDPKPV